LVAATAALVDIPSVSHHEQLLADQVESWLRPAPWLDVVRVGDNVIARTSLRRPSRLILGGHLDTVPPNGNAEARVVDDTVWGLGSVDMKSGLAVMLSLALACSSPATDVTYVFYACEEVAREHNGLSQVFRERPDLLVGDAAILGEPTGGRVEAGCQGVLKLAVTVGGQRAHTARPWMGVNAIHRLGPVLAAAAGYVGREPVLDGCQYREALQAVRVEGGVAGNVVPDSATVWLNHRFAPDRDASAALAAVSEVLDPALSTAPSSPSSPSSSSSSAGDSPSSGGDRIELVESAPSAPPGLDHPLLARLVTASGEPPRAKLGWTDVAFFAERGIPATNFGPGDPTLAHTAGEHVERSEIEAVHSVLFRLLTE
jgi:succinyl-diaminopimelate desuccinylase